MKEQFAYKETAGLLKLLDAAAQKGGVSRGQAFEDFLHMTVCSLSGGRMEEQYLGVVARYTKGKPGKRGCDLIAELFGKLVAAMEDTRDEVRDVLGDLFQGGITYGEQGQFLTPEHLCNLMARVLAEDDANSPPKKILDPCCGSGRMLLATSLKNRNQEFLGQDVDLRCVRMTAINLGLRNLYGYVFWGNSLTGDVKLAYRTGFDGRGVIREIPLSQDTSSQETEPVPLQPPRDEAQQPMGQKNPRFLAKVPSSE